MISKPHIGPGAWRHVGAGAVTLALLFAPLPAMAQDAAQWLTRVATAARNLNYTGTIVYQLGGRMDTSRIVHLNEGGQEWEKLVSLDGAPREIIRSGGEVRFYFPEVKVMKVEPRTFRNAFPSLSPDQVKSLAQYYDFRVVAGERIAGHSAEVVVFVPRDGLRYGHKFWSDAATGLLLKARLVNERGEVVEQFAFTDVTVNAKIDRDMVKPSWTATAPEWTVRQSAGGEVVQNDTGWVIGKVPPGFTKINEGFRKVGGKRDPIAHIVLSDGLVAVSVFIEPVAVTQTQIGLTQSGALNVFSTRNEAFIVTVLGEAPPATVRQIAQSVGRRATP
ncbi:MAG: MucB/RseB C-terminal domain-containing protein [Casimicrobiaceae bacterium]